MFVTSICECVCTPGSPCGYHEKRGTCVAACRERAIVSCVSCTRDAGPWGIFPAAGGWTDRACVPTDDDLCRYDLF